MKKLRLYLDSSIFGWSLNQSNPGRFAEANLLLKQIAEGKFIGAYSWIRQQEIESSPDHIAKKLWQKSRVGKIKSGSRSHKNASKQTCTNIL